MSLEYGDYKLRDKYFGFLYGFGITIQYVGVTLKPSKMRTADGFIRNLKATKNADGFIRNLKATKNADGFIRNLKATKNADDFIRNL
jgi:hypothetical protein